MPEREQIALLAAALAAALAITDDLDEGFVLTALISAALAGTITLLGVALYATLTRSTLDSVSLLADAGLRELIVLVVAVMVASAVTSAADPGTILGGVLAAIIAAGMAFAASLALERVRERRA